MVPDFEQRKIQVHEALRAAIDPLDYAYWHGYGHGLRRAHWGERLGLQEEHEDWMALMTSENPEYQRIGRGYRDALQLAIPDTNGKRQY